MPLKEAAGNMYQSWVSHTHNHIEGQCPHKCPYCYVQHNRFGVSPKYQGELRLNENELGVDYGGGKSIFIEYMNDMFATNVYEVWIQKIIMHCKKYSKNEYIIQTKNPMNTYMCCGGLPSAENFIPKKNFIIGTTIETDLAYPKFQGNAPSTQARAFGIKQIKELGYRTFITIEPIMRFSHYFANFIVNARPDFVNIGADSKLCFLPEPDRADILILIDKIKRAGIEIKQKGNLNRLLK